MPLVRTNITLPAETLAIIDEVAGPRGRSAWIAEVLGKQAKRDRMKKVWRENFGALRGSTTWGTTPEEVLETLKEIRASWDRPHVDALWDQRRTNAQDPGHDAPDRLRERPARRRRDAGAPVRGSR
ncbi:MAG TPA: hypothetical protein VLM76_01265 [Patescibacteria group bacterium]|nr:hypothetical protein [Patescibacteria group bacterium]